MYSFYGGKQGRSYKITAHFDSIWDMVQAFNQGGDYTDAQYDEYVIIDTVLRRNLKNNAENGILYRRGYDFNQAFNPHEVPLFPASPTVDPQTGEITAPTLQPNQYTEIAVDLWVDDYEQEYTYNWDSPKASGNYKVTQKVPKYYDFHYKLHNDSDFPCEIIVREDYFNLERWNDDWEEFVTHPGGGAEYIGQIVGPEGGSPAVEILDWDEWRRYTQEEGAIEPIRDDVEVNPKPGYDAAAAGQDGYDEQGFHDEIQYGYCTIRDLQGNVEGCYIAFDIPYTVFKFDAASISAYSEKGRYNPVTNTWTYDNLIEEQSDSLNHPYYKHYHIDIPEGIHGKNVEDLTIRQYGPYGASDAGDFLTYRIRSYDASQEGSLTDYIQLSPYKVITSLDQLIRQDKYGDDYNYRFPYQLNINYTYDVATRVPYQVVERIWRQTASNYEKNLRKDHVYIQMSTGELIDAGIVTTIKRVWKQEENSEVLLKDHLYIQLSNDEETDRTIDCGLLKMVTDVTKEEDGNVYAHYNDNTKNRIPMTEVQKIAFAGDLFLIKFKDFDMSQYSGPTYEDPDDPDHPWINLGAVVKGNHVLTHFDTVEELEAAYPNGLGRKPDGSEDPETKGHEGWLVTVGIVDPVSGIPQYNFYGFDYFNIDSEHPYGKWYALQDLNSESIDPAYSVLLAESDSQGRPDHPKREQLQAGGLWFVVLDK